MKITLCQIVAVFKSLHDLNANNLDPNVVPQNIGSHLRFKLFNFLILCQKQLDRNNEFLQFLKETKLEKNHCKGLIHFGNVLIYI